MLKVGDRAPDFDATDHTGRRQKLSALLTAGPVIVYFYPADFTPVCTAEACLFRDQSDALEKADIRIVGISPQSDASHKRFAAAHALHFPLLADPSKTIIRAYGVDGPLGFGVRRATFLIDPDGTISRRVVADLLLGSHKAFIASVLEQNGPDS